MKKLALLFLILVIAWPISSQVLGDQAWTAIPGYHTLTEAPQLCPSGSHVADVADIQILRKHLGAQGNLAFEELVYGVFNFELAGYYDADNNLRRLDEGGYFWVQDKTDLNNWHVFAAVDGLASNRLYLRKRVDYRHSMKDRLAEFKIGVRCVSDRPSGQIVLNANSENIYYHSGATISVIEFFGSDIGSLQLVVNSAPKASDRKYVSYSAKYGLRQTLFYFETGQSYTIWVSSQLTR